MRRNRTYGQSRIHYLPHAKRHKRSWRRDEELFRLRIAPAFGSLKLNQLTRKSVQGFHSALPAQGLSKASADHHVKLLRRMLNLAVQWSYLEANPISGIELFNEDNRLENYLTADELHRLLTVLRSDENRSVCLIAMFLLSTGCRLNEALQATWRHIDRGQRVWRILAINSKSKRMRSVPLNESALHILDQLGTEGEFTDPIRSITSFVLRLYPEKEPQVNIGTAASIGVWIGMRPSFDGVINVSQREFDFVLAMAQAGKLVSIHTTFQEPYYNRSSISSVSFSCELPLEDPR